LNFQQATPHLSWSFYSFQFFTPLSMEMIVKQLPWRNIHFIGIGGVGMSGLATILTERGVAVSGTDAVTSSAVCRLRSMGCRVEVGHHADHLPAETQLVIFSSAVPEDNPEYRKARELGIPCQRRGNFLAELAQHYETVVAVAGSHGKTTTTAMLAHILLEAGLNPGYLIGGEMPGWAAPAAAGNGRILVTEVDESDGTQAFMRCSHAIVSNVEDDHCWSHGGVQALEQCFVDFATAATHLFTWESPKTRELFESHPHATFLATADIPKDLRLSQPGEHNRINATLALTVAADLGVSPAESCQALATFGGVARRMTQHYRSADGATIIMEDYAHHPTELRSALQALRSTFPEHRLTLVFQPHRYERIKRYAGEFAELLAQADRAMVTAPFAAWCQDNNLADPQQIVDLINKPQADLRRDSLEDLAGVLTAELADAGGKNLVAVIGAGDIGKLPALLQESLISRELDERFNLLHQQLPNLDLSRELSWRELTTLKLGKARPLLARPDSMAQLAELLRLAQRQGIPVLPLGAGSNMVGADRNLLQIVVQLTKGEFARVASDKSVLEVGAGLPLPKLIRQHAKAAAALAWIPGSVGGAVRMNAGAHGASLGQFVQQVEGLTAQGEPWQRSGAEMVWSYRGSDIPPDVFICRVRLRFPTCEDEEFARELDETGAQRRTSQPQAPSAGCVFRNAGATSAGRLLDQCGCKGLTEGGCQISPVHANFIVARNPANENDFLNLLIRARRQVACQTGIILRPEVTFADPQSTRLAANCLRAPHVAVLKGGPSSERAISLLSGAAIANALRNAGYQVDEVDVTGHELPVLPKRIDVVFPALHGEFGEDGQVQRLLDERGLAYVGCGAAASELIMDKDATKAALCEVGLPTPQGVVLRDPRAPMPEGVSFPLIVKPNRQGSSVGLTRLDGPDPDAWRQALENALAGDSAAIAEAYIDGAEITVGLLDGQPLPVIEIVPPDGHLYDYDAKYEYKNGHTRYCCPPETVNEAIQAEAQRLAVRAYEVLGARHLLRVDFCLDAQGQPWILEANSMPGFTATSLLPKAAAAKGISFVELCARLVHQVS
jgi:UDP-N-acetylmuramate--alanine ligase